MLKQVTNTFIKFFTIFILVIIAFTFSFCVVLKPPSTTSPSVWGQLRKDWNNYTVTSNNTAFYQFKEPAVMFVNTLEDALQDNETIFRNFENPFTSFQMTLLMLAGQSTIEPYTLDSAAKQILFMVFVCTSFILFNLINGLAITDVVQLKQHAEFLNLKQQIRNAAESEGVLYDVYGKVTKMSMKSWMRKIVLFIMSFLVWRYPYLHSFENLCVDFKKKHVKYEIHNKRIPILRTRYGKDEKYILNEEESNKLSAIIETRQNQEESVNEKVEHLQAEMKNLKMRIRSQHEELKKLIQECLSEKDKEE